MERRSSNQLEMIRRYSRILRQEAAQYRGSRIGARERRVARETAARAALEIVRPTKTKPTG